MGPKKYVDLLGANVTVLRGVILRENPTVQEENEVQDFREQMPLRCQLSALRDEADQ